MAQVTALNACGYPGKPQTFAPKAEAAPPVVVEVVTNDFSSVPAGVIAEGRRQGPDPGRPQDPVMNFLFPAQTTPKAPPTKVSGGISFGGRRKR